MENLDLHASAFKKKIKDLECKLRETEVRLSSNMVEAISQVIKEEEDPKKILDYFWARSDMDMLEMERQRANEYMVELELLKDVVDASHEFKMAFERASSLSLSVMKNVGDITVRDDSVEATRMVNVKREKLFSLDDELDIKGYVR